MPLFFKSSLLINIVNHNSTDKSELIIKEYKNKFFKITILQENFPIHCGGKPRNTGFREAIKLAETKYNIKVPIATVDADIIISELFGKEIIDNLKSQNDIVTFNERHNQKELIKFIKNQPHKDSAIKAILGLSWFRYQLLWALSTYDIKETRGSGYAMTVSTLKALKHQQPVDSNGLPVTGENNRLSIIANRKNLKTYMSPFYSIVHPRRELESCFNISTKGYKRNSGNSEIFKLSRKKLSYPNLNKIELDNYLKQGILREIRRSIIRVIAYNKSNDVKNLFQNPTWKRLIENAEKYIEKRSPDLDTLAVVGNGVYTEMFDFSVTQTGSSNVNSFVEEIIKNIPSAELLTLWSQKTQKAIEPDYSILKLN